MKATSIILGAALLIFGRRLYWLFVGIAGFLVGTQLGAALFADRPEWVVLLVAAGAGLVGALTAVVVQRIAVALAGFFAAGYLALVLAQSLSVAADGGVFFAVGGVIGAILASLAMDPVIIALSSLVGAAAVAGGLTVAQPLHSIVFVGLAIMGLLIQSRLMGPRDAVS
jgi:hypothetical protein